MDHERTREAGGHRRTKRELAYSEGSDSYIERNWRDNTVKPKAEHGYGHEHGHGHRHRSRTRREGEPKGKRRRQVAATREYSEDYEVDSFHRPSWDRYRSGGADLHPGSRRPLSTRRRPSAPTSSTDGDSELREPQGCSKHIELRLDRNGIPSGHEEALFIRNLHLFSKELDPTARPGWLGQTEAAKARLWRRIRSNWKFRGRARKLNESYFRSKMSVCVSRMKFQLNKRIREGLSKPPHVHIESWNRLIEIQDDPDVRRKSRIMASIALGRPPKDKPRRHMQKSMDREIPKEIVLVCEEREAQRVAKRPCEGGDSRGNLAKRLECLETTMELQAKQFRTVVRSLTEDIIDIKMHILDYLQGKVGHGRTESGEDSS